jgi:hypothetical protein
MLLNLCLNSALILKTKAQVNNSIFSIQNSFLYANYLVKTQDYALAAQTLKTLLTNDTLKNNAAQKDSISLQIAINHRKAAQFDSALAYLNPNYTKNTEFYKEYIHVLLLQRKFDFIFNLILKDTILTSESKELIKLDVYLLQGNWKKAEVQLENVKLNSMQKIYAYNKIVDKGLETRKKKIWIGVLMSAFVPGLGKAYAQQYWEGIFSFSETVLLGFGAFHVFQQKGSSNVFGWTFAGLATGFYAGNIYGTVKSIKKYNQKIENQFRKDAEELVFSDN